MGFGIYVAAKLPVSGLMRRPMKLEQLAEALDEALRAELTDPLDAACYQMQAGEAGIYASIHPNTEPLSFEPHEGGRVAVSTKTSVLGPGFHVYLLELVERLGARCGLKWEWDEDSDETGYFASRDFPALQGDMAVMLRGIAKMLLEGDRSGHVAMHMGFDQPHPERVCGVITPMGPLSWDWLETLANSESPESIAKDYYIWWDKDRDAEYWRKRGVQMLWTDIKWRPPASEAEEQTCRDALECFRRAKSADARVQLPGAEIREIVRALEADPDSPAEPPPARGIGYCRSPLPFSLPGGWSITLPGYFYKEVDDDGGTTVYFFAKRSVEVTTYSTSGEKRATADDLAGCLDEDVPEGTEALDFSDDEYRRRGYMVQEDEDGEARHELRAVVAVNGHFAIVSVCFADEADEDWAMDVVRSMRHRAPEE